MGTTPNLVVTDHGSSSGTFTLSVVNVQPEDFALLCVETANQAVSTPSGWTAITNNGIGTPGAAGGVALHTFYKFVTSGSLSVTVPDSGNHQVATLVVYRGVDTTNPLNGGIASGSGSASPLSTSDIATSVDNCKILTVVASDYDSNSSNVGAYTNASLSSITTANEDSTATSTGGSVKIFSGVLTTAGNSGSGSVILSPASTVVYQVFGLRPSTSRKLLVNSLNIPARLYNSKLDWSNAGELATSMIENFESPSLLTWTTPTPSNITATYVASLTEGATCFEIKRSIVYSLPVYMYSNLIDLTKLRTISFDYEMAGRPTGHPAVTLSLFNSVYAENVVIKSFTANQSGSVSVDVDDIINLATYDGLDLSACRLLITFPYYSGTNYSTFYLRLDNLQGKFLANNVITLVATPSSIAVNPENVNFLRDYIFSIDQLSIPALAQEMDLFQSNPKIVANPLTIDIGRPSTSLLYNHKVSITPTAFTFTSNNTTLTRERKLVVSTSNLPVVSVNSGTLYNHKVSVTPALVTAVSPNNIAMAKGYGVYTSTLALAITPTETTTLKKNFKLGASSLSIPVTLRGIATGVYPPVKQINITTPIPQIVTAFAPVIEIPTLSISTVAKLDFYYFYMIKFSGTSLPKEHVKDSYELNADAIVELFELQLSGSQGTIYMKLNKSGSWQGNIYEGTGIKMDGVSKSSDDENSRPKLTMWNPEGIFSSLVNSGALEGATFTRIRVLKTNYDLDLPISTKQQWKISRVSSLKVPNIECELRSMLDGQFFLTPGRMFIPPEFKVVSLS